MARSALIALALLGMIAMIAALGKGVPDPLAPVLGVLCIVLGYVVGQKSAKIDPAVEAAEGANPPVENAEATRALRDLIAILDLPAFALDDENAVAGANAGVREIFPGIADGRLIHQVSRGPALLQAINTARDLGAPQACEIQSRSPTGRRLLVSVTPLKYTATADRNPHLLLQFSDLTEQDRLMQLRTDFIANASHELRTPLATIRGFVETLQGPASNDTASRQKFLGIMQAQAARMSRILDDLLSLSRIEMREHVTPSDLVDVAQILRTTAGSLELLAGEAKINLRLAVETGSTLVRGDGDELVQVFQNLIQNAIKYGRENGNVEVTLASRPSRAGHLPKVVVSVKDDGPGIAEEHLPRLTERFYRVDTATSRERGGTGLGLAIVKHIISRHRGELKITSALGMGSAFTVILDAAA